MPPSAASSLLYTYDAWDRLVKFQLDDGTTVHPRAEYEYNGLHWRTVKRSDTNPFDTTHALDQARSMYYSPNWQLLEERIAEDYQTLPGTDRVQQYVWGPHYIDEIILHRQDNNADGDYTDTSSPADATFYHLTDAQYSSVAIMGRDQVVSFPAQTDPFPEW